jgi:hypothetical protein
MIFQNPLSAYRSLFYFILLGYGSISAVDRQIMTDSTGVIYYLTTQYTFTLPYLFPGEYFGVKQYIMVDPPYEKKFVCSNPRITTHDQVIYYRFLNDSLGRVKYGKLSLSYADEAIGEDTLIELQVEAIGHYAEPTAEDSALGRNVGNYLGVVKPVCQVLVEAGIELNEADLQRMSMDSSSIVINADKQTIRLLMFNEEVGRLTFYHPPVVAISTHGAKTGQSRQTGGGPVKGLSGSMVRAGSRICVFTLAGRQIVNETMAVDINRLNLFNRLRLLSGYYLISIRAADGVVQEYRMSQSIWR